MIAIKIITYLPFKFFYISKGAENYHEFDFSFIFLLQIECYHLFVVEIRVTIGHATVIRRTLLPAFVLLQEQIQQQNVVLYHRCSIYPSLISCEYIVSFKLAQFDERNYA
jgi:hypothetical protein